MKTRLADAVFVTGAGGPDCSFGLELYQGFVRDAQADVPIFALHFHPPLRSCAETSRSRARLRSLASVPNTADFHAVVLRQARTGPAKATVDEEASLSLSEDKKFRAPG